MTEAPEDTYDPIIDVEGFDNAPSVSESLAGISKAFPQSNPKTLMGKLKVPMLTVLPLAGLVHMADAMRFGAFEAVKKDGSRGYGPYNWRDQPIEAGVYVDAALRHLMQYWDGEDNASDSKASHLGHAMATIGILIDAIENGTAIDDRPKVRNGVATKLFAKLKKS